MRPSKKRSKLMKKIKMEKNEYCIRIKFLYLKEKRKSLMNLFDYSIAYNIWSHDEGLFNFFLFFTTIMVLKYLDETVTCKRKIDEGISPFSILQMTVIDVTSASFGFDPECMDYFNMSKFIFLLVMVFSIIFQINYVYALVQEKSKEKSSIVFELIKKSLTAMVISNFSSKLVSLFFNTKLGKTLYSFWISSFFFLSETSCSSINTTNIWKYLPKTDYILTSFIPSVRSRYLLDKLYSPFICIPKEEENSKIQKQKII